MGNKVRRIAAIASVVVLASIWTSPSLAGDNPCAAWFSLALGCGGSAGYMEEESFDAMAIALGASIQPCDTILSIRYTELDTKDVSGDIALLLERSWDLGGTQVTGGAGLGLLFRESSVRRECFCGQKSVTPRVTKSDAPGPVWHLQLARPVSGSIRAGLEAFGAFHELYGFWGVALVLDVGCLAVERGRCDP